LRTLQERVVQPVGGSRTVTLNVRVISATHQDLDDAIAQGLFRKDLYYRIKGVELTAPPLRVRREDIVLLAEFFLDRLATAAMPRSSLTPAAIERLIAHSWPGNVRELEHTLAAALAMASGDEIRPDDLRLSENNTAPEASSFEAYFGMPLMEAKASLINAFERAMIRDALDKHAGNVSAAARHLGLHRQSLQQKIAQMRIKPPS